MLKNVFDVEMKRIFFDERIQRNYKEYIWYAVFSRDMAYESYRVAIFSGFRFDRAIVYANFTLDYLCHDEKWDRFVKADKLQKKAQSLLKVTPSMREFYAMRFKRLLRDFE